MMLDINLIRLREGFGEYLPIGGLVAVLLVAEMVIVLSSGHFGPNQMPAPGPLPEGYSNTRVLGRLLYTVYAYPFEIAAAILLVAIVAAIALTLRRRKDSKYQNPAQQIRIERSARVRMVKMPSEKKG
jgi:NADH-quinone oxidoreductase subunit J